ncbi:N-formylglutamate amidohydrolase [Bartonella sp. M0187]|uniref:N-formylglutamate amidohydrolase n=1 Tax=Bartonella apihabitans TaxID=2750929 RepID=UPI0018DBB530|nr:N-formylglutamate amidohydrolase [Bartonella apihabitans]MBI0026690.1 N-formylglutamate amidohydrolase [Bartonella apihabitans]
MKQKENFYPFEEIPGNMEAGLVLICDHASNALPDEYGSLGLQSSELFRHIAYDIGAEMLTKELAKRLEVPAVVSHFSRLLIDPNRGEDDPTLIMQLSDGSVIPDNYPMSETERQRRIENYYKPYDLAVGRLIAGVEEASGKSPFVVSVHSFTPVWHGQARPWHIGLLWDSDRRTFDPLFTALNEIAGLEVGDNEPYDGALKGDTMYRHCTTKGIAHILIEVRQDLIADEEGVIKWADYLQPLFHKINGMPMIHMKQIFPSRADW